MAVLEVPMSTFLLAFVGALTLLTYASSLFRFLFSIAVGSGVPLYRFKASEGTTYAIVTGCTGGIGLEFARQLAANGFGLILVGRRQSALDELARELESAHKIRTLSVVADAADPADLHAAVQRVAAVARTVDTGILINNVGASHDMPVAFHETDPAEIDAIVQTNISWTLQLTRAVLPLLVARSTPGHAPKSLVMTIGSLSGRIPSPLLAAYSCTKGGLKTWNHALAAEVQSLGVVCTMVFPAFVVSLLPSPSSGYMLRRAGLEHVQDPQAVTHRPHAREVRQVDPWLHRRRPRRPGSHVREHAVPRARSHGLCRRPRGQREREPRCQRHPLDAQGHPQACPQEEGARAGR